MLAFFTPLLMEHIIMKGVKNMGKNDIRLSKKYGLNPTIPICFWCGKERNEIALLGHIGKRGEDIEAPQNMILDYNPCGDCLRIMNRGVTIMEASDIPISEGQRQIQEGIYPTGKWCVIRQEAADRIFGDYLNGSSKVLVDSEVYSMFQKNES